MKKDDCTDDKFEEEQNKHNEYAKDNHHHDNQNHPDKYHNVHHDVKMMMK